MKIKKGNHYPFPYFAIGLPKWISAKKITSVKRAFFFTDSCLYDLKDEDQGDVNKLFGFSIGYHHKTSFRFGWRANLKTRTIEIVGYEYHDYVRQTTMPICDVNINTWVYFDLQYSPKGQTEYVVIDNEEIVIKNTVNIIKNSGLGYTLGLYFGGNETAPQDIIVYRKKI
jgi:hypothetical protein